MKKHGTAKDIRLILSLAMVGRQIMLSGKLHAPAAFLSVRQGQVILFTRQV
jgi:hypothetical protein